MKLTLDKYFYLIFILAISWHLGIVLNIIGVLSHWIAFPLILISWAGAYLYAANIKIDSNKKAVLITGCDTGFGYALALHLDKLGFRVFAGCLFADSNGEGASTLRELGSAKLHVIQLNVVDEDEAQKARQTVENLLPEDEILWGVVNNAGLSAFGEVEWVPISTYKKMADVNVFGMILVTKVFLPLIRRAKGRIVNVASMLGRFEAPMRSPYVVTKYAVEGFSGCLKNDVRRWDVDVVLIEPGNFVAGTAIYSETIVQKQIETMWNSMSEEIQKEYEKDFKEKTQLMKTYTREGNTDISPVIDSFEEALTQKYPQPRYQPMCLYYKVRIFVNTHFPEWVYDAFYT